MACKAVFPLVLGRIADFRIEDKDLTANFSFEQDNQLAGLLLQAYPRFSTFNELNDLYQALKIRQKAGADLVGLDLDGFLLELDTLPRSMTPDQCVHGKAVLEKIDGFLAELGKDMPKAGVALENGCGLGLFIDGFSAHFKQLYVLDLSMCYLLLASKIIDERGINNAFLLCGSVENLPIQNAAIDFVHSNNVIEHVDDQLALLNEANRVLKSGGVLYVQSPNRYSLWIEPHFALPGFGFIPKPLRRRLIQRTQQRSIDDISLRSLSEFRAMLGGQSWSHCKLTFVPRHLRRTVKKGLLRSMVVTLLDSKLVGGAFDTLINNALLGIMPYHVAVCIKNGQHR